MRELTWYETHYLCGICVGCEKVADGEGECQCEMERMGEEEW